MKYCPTCHTENEEDALYCKKCGGILNQNKEQKSLNPNKKTKVKNKIKTKHHTKIKYRQKKEKQEKNMSFFQKFIMLFFILLSIILLGVIAVFGYHFYQMNNIEVPNVLGYSYDEAVSKLQAAHLGYEKLETEVDSLDEVGTVIKQNKRSGIKVQENTIIKLTVGIANQKVMIPNLVGMYINDAISTLNHQGILYKIVYEKSSKKQNTVLQQSLKAGKKVANTKVVILTVSQEDAIGSSDKEEEIPNTTTPTPSSTPIMEEEHE